MYTNNFIVTKSIEYGIINMINLFQSKKKNVIKSFKQHDKAIPFVNKTVCIIPHPSTVKSNEQHSRSTA